MRVLGLGLLCLLVGLPGVNGQGMQPVVAIHDSELTRALESKPAVSPTPTGAGTTGFQWWPTDWHYFVMPEAAKEALRSDGTAFTVVGDSNIVSGALLTNGAPKYPIVFSLASEAIRDDEIAQFTNYVAAGGFLFVGSSAFTRNPDGTARGDFAFANALGLHMASSSLANWQQNTYVSKQAAHRLVNDIPGGTLTWRMPSSSDEISWGTSPSHPFMAAHDVWQVIATDATVLMAGEVSPFLTIKPYGKGYFIYESAFQPLLGHGGFAPGMYAYLILRRSIEWAFASASIPVPKLSPWPYQYDAAFMVRHDLENFTNEIANIEASAQVEYANGAKGDYYFCTGTLRDDAYPTYNTNTIVASLRRAVTNYGATIGPHNGGLKNPGNPSLVRGNYDYWHWGPDEVLDLSPSGYANGKAYASASLSTSFKDIESWLSGITNGVRSWVACYFNATREDSIDLQSALNVKIVGDDKIGPFPFWTLSTETPGKRYAMLTQPVSDWFVDGLVAQSLEPWHPPGVHTSQTLHAAIDFYYGLGGLINFYSHTMSTGLGDAGALQLDYITYGLNPTVHPRIWSSNGLGIYQWWLQRSNAQITASFRTNGYQSTVTLAISGARDPNTAVEILLPAANASCNFQVLTNGVVASGDSYRNNGQTLKLKVGTSVTNAVVSYYPILGSGPGFTESFDAVTAPALPSGWTTSGSGAQAAWVTESSVRNTAPNAAFSPDAAAVGVNEIVSPVISLPTTSSVLSFLHSYNLESSYDGGVLEIKIGAGAFTDIITAGGSFNSGGYNSGIDVNYSNPLAGRSAWSGSSSGFVTTSVTLPAAAIGQLIQLKWRCGTDNSTGGGGWWIDSVSINSVLCACCANNPPVLPLQTDRTIPQFAALTVTNTASDADSPPGTLSYQLTAKPSGASIDGSGIILWTPGTGQAPSTNVFTTVVTDSGSPPMSATNSFNVFVTAPGNPPVITSQPSNQTNSPGTTAVFTVGASGSSLSYQWLKDGSNVAGATTSSLVLPNVSSADVATYSVIVSNSSGSLTSQGATLTVLSAPLITLQPISQTNYLGGTVSFTVGANGTGLSYQWLKNGITISGATANVLNLFSLSGLDAGAYSALVSNSAGSVSSATATLGVLITNSLPGQLLTDSFSRSSLSPWIVQAGTWSISNGVLQGGPGAVQNYGNAYITNSWADYAVQADIRFPAGGYGGGLAGRLTPSTGARYAAWVYPEGSLSGVGVLRLVKFQSWTGWSYNGANATPMQQVNLPGVGSGWHTLKLAFLGRQVSVYYDGVLMITVADAEVTPLTSGAVGADMWTGSSAYAMNLENVIVSSLAVGDVFSVNAGSTLTVPSPGVLGNDTGVFSTGTSASLVTGVANGSLALNANGSFTYTPNSGFVGTDTFSYRASSGQTNLGSAPVTIIVNGTGGVPVIVTQPVDQTNNAGTTAGFSVSATGTGLSYQWLKNGTLNLSNGGNVSGATSSSLSLANVSAADAGNYSVVVSNLAGGVTSASASLTVITAPVIVTQPINQTNNAGTTASFIVSATGTGLSYQWVRNGTVNLSNGGNVSGATSSSLSLANLSAADAGSYSVVVSNAAGGVTSTAASLTVIGAPVIVTQPISRTNNAGTPASFSVSATGSGLSYQWVKNGTVNLSDGGNVSGATSSNLSLASVSAADVGSYSVVVSNTAGGVTSTAASLTVITAPVIVTQPISQTNNAGTTAGFSVSAAGSGLSYQWVKNGTVNLSNGGNVSGATSSSLSLANVSAADAGSYSVVVSNTAGGVASTPASLTVITAPVIVTQPISQTNNAGTTASFIVSATGTGLSYQWVRNGTVNLSNGGNVSGATSSSLSLASVSAAEVGSYSVVVSNTAGAVTSTAATLTVIGAPVIVTQPISQTNNAGTTASLIVSATGTGLSYQWVRNGTVNLSNGGNVSGATSSSLSLANVSAADAGNYSVVVSNTVGAVTSTSATLTVITTPVIVTQPISQTNNAGATANFTVAATGGNLSYQWLKNGTNALANGGNILGARTATLTVSNLTATDAGGYSVIVSNTAGAASSLVASLTVVTPSGQLFTDDFSRTTISPWINRAGTWNIVGGVLQGSNSTTSAYGNVYLTNLWTDYSVQAQFQFPAGAYGGGIGARVNPTTGAHYAAWIYPENSAGGSRILRLIKFQSWTAWSYRSANFTAMQQVTLASVSTNSHTLKLTCSGNQIGVYFDGTLLINTNDLEATTYQSGGIGIDSWTDTTRYVMAVDNVVVTSVPQGTPLVVLGDEAKSAGLEAPAKPLLAKAVEFSQTLPPEISSVVVTNGIAVISWVAVPGTSYRLQFTEDVGSTNWFDVAPDVRPTESIANAVDIIGNSPRRFYRLLRLP
jgi:hypothetical protein